MPDVDEMQRAAQTLRDGGLVAFPTETVYGLGADAANPAAVARVFEVKGRPRFDPLIVHVADAAEARGLAAAWPVEAARLAEVFWPGPLTLVLPRQNVVPDLVTAGLPNVGLRVPDHPVAQDLIARAAQLGVVGVAAPSANRFGHTSPTRADHVGDEFAVPGEVDRVLDGGPCRTGVESTVVSLVPVLEGGRPVVLRLGGTPVEALQEVLGEIVYAAPGPVGEGEGKAARGQASPGMLDRHYAPRTPLSVVPSGGWSGINPAASIGILWFIGPAPDGPEALRAAPSRVLSPSGDLREAAANLFAAMRSLDAMGLDHLYAERVPDVGLGRAINDRLRRAAT